MVNAKSVIKMNFSKIKQLTQAQITALEQTTEALHTDIVQAQVIPRDKGALQGEKFFADYASSNRGKARLVNEGPYARRLYYHPEYNFKKTENPNAKGEWYEDWLPGGKKQDFAVNAYKQMYKRLGGV